MSMKAMNERISLGSENDLANPTSTANYPLGYIAEVEDSATKTVKKYIYVYASTTLTAYVPYLIGWSSTSGQEVIAAAVATSAAVYRTIGVPQVAFTSGYFGFVQIQGDCLANIHTGGATAGHCLASKGDNVSVFETLGAATITSAAVGMSKETTTTSGAAIYLFGREVFVPAS
uniref:Uncharacterized protein n=1 Tax=viral metagenome TaxID=1070528 RepID=A0A6M3LLL5_9ZZZZ